MQNRTILGHFGGGGAQIFPKFFFAIYIYINIAICFNKFALCPPQQYY